MNYVGPAYNPVEADDLLIKLQDRNNMLPEVAKTKELQYQAQENDFVATGIGGAVPTPGSSSLTDKTKFQEYKHMTKGDATTHSCYGEGNPLCDNAKYWENSPLKKITEDGKVVGIPQWMPASYMREKEQEQLKLKEK